eukprot:1426893-Rhodomonas_salina.3
MLSGSAPVVMLSASHHAQRQSSCSAPVVMLSASGRSRPASSCKARVHAQGQLSCSAPVALLSASGHAQRLSASAHAQRRREGSPLIDSGHAASEALDTVDRDHVQVQRVHNSRIAKANGVWWTHIRTDRRKSTAKMVRQYFLLLATKARRFGPVLAKMASRRASHTSSTAYSDAFHCPDSYLCTRVFASSPARPETRDHEH